MWRYVTLAPEVVLKISSTSDYAFSRVSSVPHVVVVDPRNRDIIQVVRLGEPGKRLNSTSCLIFATCDYLSHPLLVLMWLTNEVNDVFYWSRE